MAELPLFLAEWYAGWRSAGLPGVEARYGRSGPDIPTQSAWVDLKGLTRWGQLTVWETGAVEIEVNEIATIDLVFSRSEKVSSTDELEVLLAVLVAEVTSDAR